MKTKLKIICFEKNGFEDYLYWQKENKKILEKINLLIQEIVRNPFDGIGKPESLKGDLAGLYSRRINDEHRLVYAIREDKVIILQCRYHY